MGIVYCQRLHHVVQIWFSMCNEALEARLLSRLSPKHVLRISNFLVRSGNRMTWRKAFETLMTSYMPRRWLGYKDEIPFFQSKRF